ncbi:MAG: tetratricopeptide repeat protein [Bdellovibrio sp.]
MKYRYLVGVISLWLCGCGPGKPHLQTLKLNRDGNTDIQAQSYPAATAKYLEALKYDPFVGALHLNLGLTFEGTQQAEKALQSYKEAEGLAEKENNPLLMFMSRFNQAQLLAKTKKIDEALALYQKALDIIPSSQEVKTNIELLTMSQSGQGGEGENQENQDSQEGQSKQNDSKQEKGQQKESQDKDSGKDEKQKEDKQQYQSSRKYQPRPYQGQELSEGDVKKILGELKQQEEKIRAEFNKRDVKEQPRDKDW